jgi:hypothetical protein
MYVVFEIFALKYLNMRTRNLPHTYFSRIGLSCRPALGSQETSAHISGYAERVEPPYLATFDVSRTFLKADFERTLRTRLELCKDPRSTSSTAYF